MSDNVAVMRAGVIDQIGSGHDVYDRPATPFVASFVGENNVFRGRIVDIKGDEALIRTNRSGDLLATITPAAKGKLDIGADAMMFVRPEALTIGAGGEKTTLSAKVINEEFEGNTYSIFLEGDGGKEIKMSMPNLGTDPDTASGSDLTLSYDAKNAVVMPAGDLAAE